jgi:hypothetical protein
MKEKTLKQAKALQADLADAVGPNQPANPAAWKSLRKLDAIIELLETEWPAEPPKK